MKLGILRTPLFALIAFLTACNSDRSARERELELKEKELAIREKELDKKSTSETDGTDTVPFIQPESVRKYMYVVIETNEPKIVSKYVQEPAEDRSTDNANESVNSYTEGYLPREVKPSFIPAPKYVRYSQSQYFTYTSDVIEVNHFNEDEKSRVEDNYDRKVQTSIEYVNRMLAMEDHSISGDPTNAVAKILSRKSYVFDSYSEASKHREENNKTSRR